MEQEVKADRKTFTDAVRKLLATPPLPKAEIPRKRAKKVRPKSKQSRTLQ